MPKISRRDSVEMVKNIPQERSSERMCESPDQLWQRKVEHDLTLDACVEHDPAARALVLKRLRERCAKFWPRLGGELPLSAVSIDFFQATDAPALVGVIVDTRPRRLRLKT